MIATRRTRWNFALQRAVDLSLETGAPLLILEALESDYPWASDRLHRFVLDGMAANQNAAARSRACYYPYVEPSHHAGRGLLAALAPHACAVVTDHFPAFLIPRITAAAARQVRVRFEAVDSNGLIPLSRHGRAFTSARSYRAFVQRELREHLREFPEEHPLRHLPRGRSASIPPGIARQWPPATELLHARASLASLPIDHVVQPTAIAGGEPAARRRLNAFVKSDLPRYGRDHNHPDADCTSRLSPYLHFGHISAHEIFSAVMTAERWTTRRLAARGGGAREGWWGVGESANVSSISSSSGASSRSMAANGNHGMRLTSRCRSGRATLSPPTPAIAVGAIT